MRSLKLTLTLAVCTLSLAAFASSASAAYTVYQLDPSRGVGTNGWASFGDGNFCRTDFGSFVQVSGLCGGVQQVGYWAIWRTPGLPGNLYIDSVTYSSSGSAQSGRALGAGLCTDAEPYHLYCAQDWLLYIPYNDNTWVARSNTRVGSKFFKLVMTCGNTCPGATWTNGAVANMAFNMRDADTPGSTYDTASSGVKVTGGQWTSGNKDVRTWSSDGTSGVEHSDLYFDSNPSHPMKTTKSASCNRVSGGYSTFVPCPTGVAMIHGVDTTQLTDGSHTLHLVTYDASGNAHTNTQTFKVDNTAPATPASVDVVGDNSAGWRTTNDFDLTWNNAGESAETSTESGIEHVCADVHPQPEGGPDPAPQCKTGSVASLSDVTVPGEDSRGWDTDIYTIDRAGNVSDHEPIQLKLDTSTPPKPASFANGWVNRVELLAGYQQEWNPVVNAQGVISNICGYAFSVTPGTSDNPGTTMNIVGNVSGAVIPANLVEGDYYTHLRGISCAGTPSSVVTHTALSLDLTDPALEVSGVPSIGWAKSLSLSASASDARSGMTGAIEPDAVDSGAYIEHVVDGSAAGQHRGSSDGVTNDTEGLHTVNVNAYDVAGNRASKALSVGVDKSSPFGLFDLQDPNRPTLIQMPVDDPLSGVASARVEVRKVGDSGAWTVLPTSIQKRGDTTGTAAAGSLNAATVVARFTDTKLPKGTYAVRSVVTDAVGNQLIGTKSANGQDLVLSNPMRRGSLVTAGFGGRKLVCGNGKKLRKVKGCKRVKIRCTKGKNKGKKRCYKVQRKVILVGNLSKVTIGYRRSGVVKGIFNRADGSPAANMAIDIYATPRGSFERLIGSTKTDRYGYYALKVRAGVSRTVRAVYAGTELDEDAAASAQLNVAAYASLRLSKKIVGLRKTVHFRGKVYKDTDAAIPPGGLRVSLQAKSGRKWIPVVKSAVRTDKSGKFTFKYAFKKLRKRSRITFRVVVLPDSQWPFATGYSKSRALTVAP